MSYENAPATAILATVCAVCGRPLLDETSVETGMGPECRKRYGYSEIGSAFAGQANALIHRFAHVYHERGRTSAAATAELLDVIAQLRGLGAVRVAAKLVTALVRATITTDAAAGTFSVVCRYSEAFLAATRRAPGRRWDAAAKVTRFDASAWPVVAAALAESWPAGVADVDGEHRPIGALGECPVASTAPAVDACPVADLLERDGVLILRAPFCADLNNFLRTVRGRRWDAAAKANTLPARVRPDLEAELGRLGFRVRDAAAPVADDPFA